MGALAAPATVESRQQAVWLLYCVGVHSYAELSRRTGYSAVWCGQIVRRRLATEQGQRDVQEVRATQWAHLEALRIALEPAIHITRNPVTGEKLPEGMHIVPNKDDVASYIKLIHEQALLTGSHSPKQMAITNESAPAENEEAQAYAEKVVRFMELSEKLAAIGPPRTQLTTEYADELIDADVAEPEVPELLRQFESEYDERAPSPVPINFDV